MTVVENIMKNAPEWINWNAPILKALIGKKDFRPNAVIEQSGDYNCGAAANELEFFYSKLKKEATNRDFSQSRSDLLEYFADIIIGEKKLLNESDNSYIKRLLAFCECGGVKTRMTRESIEAYLSYFYSWFSVMEGIENESGISESFEAWSCADCGMTAEQKSFTKSILKMKKGACAEKSFAGLKPGYREICFFVKGEAAGEIGKATINGAVYNLSCSSNNWQQQRFLIKTDATVNIKIEATADFAADYFHLFKEEQPCFTVLVQKATLILDVADDEAVISVEPLIADDNANYTAKKENAKISDRWNYFLRSENLTEQSETWVLQKLNQLKAFGVKHKVIEVKI